MSIETVVIVGAGHGGFQAAASLRQEGFEGAIRLLSDEKGLPYQRPPLSKAYLKDGDASRLHFRPEAFYAQNAIEYLDGVRVAAIDRAERAAALEDGRRLAYDHLILATGARNRALPIPGASFAGVCALRDMADATALRAAIAGARRIAVIGAGFIGLETAAAARGLGCEATVLEAQPRIMARSVSEPMSAHLLAAHAEMGVEILLNARVSEIFERGDGAAGGVALADGAQIESDLVLICVGVVPNQELAAEAGLTVDDGVVVDQNLLTSDPAISAIGDCARFPHRAAGAMLRLESVQNAADQAKCVARRLMGRAEPYDEVAWFWSDQGPHKIQIAGLTGGADHVEPRRSEDGAKISVYCFKDGRFIGAETSNVPADHMVSRKLLAKEEPVTLEALRAAAFDLRQFR